MMTDLNKRTLQEYKSRFPDAPKTLVNAFKRLLQIADDEGCLVRILPLEACRAMIVGNRIGLADRASAGQMIYDMGHELGHHWDIGCGNILSLPSDNAYKQACEAEADKIANIMLKCLGFSDKQIAEWA